MVRVAAHAVADQLGVDPGAALLGVLVFFEDHHAGAFAHDEAVAVLVPRAAGAASGSSLRVERRGRRQKLAMPELAQRRFGAAGDHHVGHVVLDEPRRRRRWRWSRWRRRWRRRCSGR